ncbi:MAG TPA: hypothetical protein VMT20_12620 [Terriglobia bacterium]|nr:hypothetical protein [Terriglobia bacterium]
MTPGRDYEHPLLLDQPGSAYCGAVLHDIGKISDLSYGRAFGYTLQGNLVSHVAIGLVLLEENILTVLECWVAIRPRLGSFGAILTPI